MLYIKQRVIDVEIYLIFKFCNIIGDARHIINHKVALFLFQERQQLNNSKEKKKEIEK
jgi:hypothetical protein